MVICCIVVGIAAGASTSSGSIFSALDAVGGIGIAEGTGQG